MVHSFGGKSFNKACDFAEEFQSLPYESVHFQLKLCLTVDYPFLPDRLSVDTAIFKATMISGRFCSELQKSKAIFSSY